LKANVPATHGTFRQPRGSSRIVADTATPWTRKKAVWKPRTRPVATVKMYSCTSAETANVARAARTGARRPPHGLNTFSYRNCCAGRL
jgi:hypothetical protein